LAKDFLRHSTLGVSNDAWHTCIACKDPGTVFSPRRKERDPLSIMMSVMTKRGSTHKLIFKREYV
jgi:hypothetical protein